jgi:hypothetical protein
MLSEEGMQHNIILLWIVENQKMLSAFISLLKVNENV